jgi:hypothetical protein
MSTLTPPPGVDPTSTLKHVARHLVAAEACAVRAGGAAPDLGDVAVGAALLTSQVLRLLPPGEVVDDVATPHGDDVGALLREGERLIRAHPIEALPPGTAAFVADLCDLIAQAPA